MLCDHQGVSLDATKLHITNISGCILMHFCLSFKRLRLPSLPREPCLFFPVQNTFWHHGYFSRNQWSLKKWQNFTIKYYRENFVLPYYLSAINCLYYFWTYCTFWVKAPCFLLQKYLFPFILLHVLIVLLLFVWLLHNVYYFHSVHFYLHMKLKDF